MTQREMPAGKRAKVSKPARSNAQLNAFYEEQPQAQPAPGHALPARAYDVGLVLEHREFRPLRDVSCKRLCRRIVLPAKRSFLQVTSFLARAMRNSPGLAFDGIGNQRQEVDLPALEAQLRLNILLRAAA